jgi:DnaA family protein
VTLTQLPLEIHLNDDATFANYCSVTNKIAYDCIIKTAKGIGEQFMYLWGNHGVGKTHLLQAACHLASEQNISAIYLPLDSVNVIVNIQKLQGLENVNLVCLDNIHFIEKNNLWEEAIFHLFNKIKNNKNKLIITGNRPPTKLAIDLSDLKSRLSWGIVYQLHPLGEQDKLAVLSYSAKNRGLYLDVSVWDFLLKRCSRSMSDLFKILDKLDKESLAKQRKLTIPFVKQILNI